MRYKIRKEHAGGIAFDRVERRLIPVSLDQISRLEGLLKGPCGLVAIAGLPHLFTPSGAVNYSIIDASLAPDGGWGENCLAAPNRLYLELTRDCNLRCRMCYNQAARRLPGELSLAQIQRLLDEMDRIAVFEARLTGGEPTRRPDFFAILDYAIARDFYVSLATNGVWDSGLTAAVCQRRIDDVIVSLDGPEAINDWVRAGGSFRTSISTIRALKEAGIAKVRINTVISRWNWREVELLFQICSDYDLLLIDFIHPRPFGRGAAPEAQQMMLTPDQMLEFNLLVRRLRDKYPGVKVVMDFDLLSTSDIPRHPIVPRVFACPAGREFAFVSPQGYVFPCGVAPVHDVSLMSEAEKRLFLAGNVLERSILEIWHDSPVWVPFRDLNKCKPPKCRMCGYWGKKCFGTCPLGAYYANGHLEGEDPYCYSDLVSLAGLA